MYAIANIINIICNILIYMLLGRAILSWFVNPYNANPQSILYKIYALITTITEPIVRPCRALLSRFNTGPIDFSVFIAMLLIIIVQRVLIAILI